MKSGTQHHIKTKRLMRLLDLPLCFAVGVIETLWLVTAECADEGNIGKYSNAEIADALGWPGDADKLVSALLEARWLDECDTNRLVIHDWIDHCPDYIRERLRKRGWRKTKRLTSTENGTGTGQAGTTTGPAAACPAFTKPNPTNPTNNKGSKSKASTSNYSPGFESFWKAFPTGRRSKKPDAWVSYQGAVEALIAVHGSQEAAEAYLERRAAEYASSEQGRGKYVRGPCPWLNQQAWEDPPESWGLVGSRTSADRVASDADLANWNPLDGGLADG